MNRNKARIEAHYNALAGKYNDMFSKGWLSGERKQERTVLFGLLDLKPGLHILDAGCGEGFDALKLSKMGCAVYGIDFSEKMIESLKSKGIDGECADLESFDLNQKFDRIVCSGASEFVGDIQKLFIGFRKHLNQGGSGVLLVPKNNIVGKVYQLYHLILHRIQTKLYSKAQLERFITSAGLNSPEFHDASFWVHAIKFKL